MWCYCKPNKILRSGPTSVQVKNIADGTIRTIRKSSVSLVNFSENQLALQLMRDNFPKSLLWGHNMYHRKQAPPTYLYHSSQRQTKNKVKSVTFSEISQTLCLNQLISIEEQFLVMYYDFSLFPKFLKRNNIIHPVSTPTKFENNCFVYSNSMQSLFSCPCTTSKELNILFK